MLFSIIVPVYNVKQYLYKCFGSIEGQSCKDYEVIIIDDGSTDGSSDVCDKYVTKYAPKWKVIHQKNGGLSNARNNGIKNAKGEFIVLLDSDDFFYDESALDKLRELIESDFRDGFFPDVILSTAYGYYENSDQYVFRQWNIKDKHLDGTTAMQKIFKCKTYVTGPWYLIVKRNFIINKNLWFEDGLLHEDELWIPQVFLSTEKVTINKNTYYCNRCDRKGSIVYENNINKIVDRIKIIDRIQTIASSLERKQKKIISYRSCQIMIGIIKDLKEYDDCSLYDSVDKRLFILLNCLSPKYRTLWILCKIIGIRRVSNLL